MISNSGKHNIIVGLVGFVTGLFSLWTIYRWRRRQEERLKSDPSVATIQHTDWLHWNLSQERRGLGDLLVKANHIAITVSDVGRSLNFYVDVLGLQQIRRPSFDRHGAWLTMGNIELHLIKGIPVIPPVDNLQVGHIAFETPRVNEVLCRLRQLNIDFRQNLSVTNPLQSKSKGTRLNQKSLIIQYFFTDPDGYYLELCNCDVLTEFSFDKEKPIDQIHYHEGIHTYKKFDVIQAALRWKQNAQKHRTEELDHILQTTPRATKVDKKKLNNLLKRRLIYGDILQGFSNHDIKEALLRTYNFVPLTVKILTRKRGENRFYQPPAFVENGELIKPQPFFMNENDFH